MALQYYPWDAPVKQPHSRHNALYAIVLIIVMVRILNPACSAAA